MNTVKTVQPQNFLAFHLFRLLISFLQLMMGQQIFLIKVSHEVFIRLHPLFSFFVLPLHCLFCLSNYIKFLVTQRNLSSLLQNISQCCCVSTNSPFPLLVLFPSVEFSMFQIFFPNILAYKIGSLYNCLVRYLKLIYFSKD